MRYISLGGFLFLFWLSLSGHYTLMWVSAGAGCSALCVYAAFRLKIVDHEGLPTHLLVATLTYYPWLIIEIIKSAWSVTKIILNPILPISPTVIVVKASQKTSEGLATYANSITLTPGTITIGVENKNLTVHALVKKSAQDLKTGRMDAHVSRFEGTA